MLLLKWALVKQHVQWEKSEVMYHNKVSLSCYLEEKKKSRNSLFFMKEEYNIDQE